MKRLLYRILVLIAFLVFWTSGSFLIANDAPVSFHREVMPILRINCVACHKPGKLKGGLDLTTHTALLTGGDAGPAIKPGDAEGSRLQRIAQIKSDQGPVFAIAFSGDGTRIATGGYDGRIRFYNAANGEWVQDFASVAIR